MTDNQDKYDDFTIVPERDDLVTPRGKPRAHAATPVIEHTTIAAAGTSGPVKLLLSLLVLGLLGTAGGAYYFYQQGEVTRAALAEADGRLDGLENRLLMVDEAAEQSSLGLLQRVDFNFSEIDKLWAARNVLRQNVAEITTTLQTHTQSLTDLETALTSQAGRLNQQQASLQQSANALTAVQERLEALGSQVSGVQALNQELASINQELEVLRSLLNTQGGNVASIVQANQQDIESINIFRLQVNQTLNEMRRDINALQERVGPPR